MIYSLVVASILYCQFPDFGEKWSELLGDETRYSLGSNKVRVSNRIYSLRAVFYYFGGMGA